MVGQMNRWTDVNGWTDEQVDRWDRCEQVDSCKWVDRWHRWIDRRDGQMTKAAKTNSKIKQSQD